MNTLLVLTDFSDQAWHAAEYASIIVKQLHYEQVVLLHASQLPPAVRNSAYVLATSAELNAENETALKHEAQRLKKILPEYVELKYIIEDRPLARGVEDVCKDYSVDLIVMGITGKGKLEQTIIGSNATAMATEAPVSLIIVPEKAELVSVERIVLGCDPSRVESAISEKPIQKLIGGFDVPVDVVTVLENEVNEKLILEKQKQLLHTIFNPEKVSYHVTDYPSKWDGLNLYATKNKASIIVLVAQQYSLLEKLFHKSVTKRLAFSTSIPLMVLR